MTFSFPEALDLLCALALEAGEAILERRGAAPMFKADASPVTAADLAADAVIRRGLARRFPGIPAVTEEDAESQTAAAPDRFFLVDPLDGTRDFVKGDKDFTVNIALIEGGAAVLGVVLAPAHDRLFAGARGAGAFEARPSTGARRPMKARRADPAALRAAASKSNLDAATKAYIARHKAASLLQAGSSLKFALVAAGEADFYPRLGPTMEWDTAAGQAVLEAAGGLVRSLPGGAPLAYGKHGWRNGWFVAHGPGLSPEAP